MASAPLDNPVWACLNGEHRRFSDGDGLARRYRRGFSPIAALAGPGTGPLEALAQLTEAGETLATGFVSPGPIPSGWEVEAEASVLQMVSTAPIAARPADVEPVALGEGDAAAMMELTELTHPGPYGPRTHQLGAYLGIKAAGRLVAMAGERMVLPGFREISAVCTHPDWQGRGCARLLITRLADGIRREGRIPFLHVLASNAAAIGLYERLGFRTRLASAMRVLRRVSD